VLVVVRISTLGALMISAGVNLLVGAFLLALLIPRLPVPVLSGIVVAGFILLMLGNVVTVTSSLRPKTLRRCTICRLDITGRAFPIWKNPHYESVHHDYSLWLKHWIQTLILVAGPSVAILVSSEYFWLKYGGVYSYLAGLTALSWITFAFSWTFHYWRKIRGFRRGWKDNHQV
jgi:hypothetical protein